VCRAHAEEFRKSGGKILPKRKNSPKAEEFQPSRARLYIYYYYYYYYYCYSKIQV